MDELLNYLIAQREERAAKLAEYAAAVAEYNDAFEVLKEAEAKVDAFGDMSALTAEVEKLDGFIAEIAAKSAGAVEEPVAEEVADAEVVTEAEEVTEEVASDGAKVTDGSEE